MAVGDAAGMQVCLQGDDILRLSKGKRRVPLEDLGPALFNRFGAATSGRRCRELMTRIVRVEGLVVYRYEAVWCIEPNPNDPLEVYRHGMEMYKNDKLLPTLVEKPLKALFRKTHLVSGLLKTKQGLMSYEDSAQLIDSKAIDQSEWQTTMTEGVFAEVFSYEDYIKHKPQFLALMASDNFDAGFALAEDEIQMLRRMKNVSSDIKIQPGQNHFDAVRAEIIKYSGSRWVDDDLVHFYNYSKTVAPEYLTFSCIYQRFICDPSTFTVSSRFYQQLSMTPVQQQMNRLSVVVRMQTSDSQTECTTVRGTKVGGAVKAAHFEFWKEIVRGK